MNIKKILSFIIIISLAVISFYKIETNFNLPQSSNKSENKTNSSSKSHTLKVLDTDNKIVTMSLEEYVIGVVAAEMPASFELEALKAQAVASRTYAMYKKSLNNEYDVTTTISDQAYINEEQMQAKWNESFEKYYNKIKQAVNETKNQIITYQDQAIKAYYFSMSNGYTEDAINVFNASEDYLVSVESVDEATATTSTYKTINIPKEEFCNKLNIECQNIIVSNINKSSTGRINSLNVNGKEFSGTEFRQKLSLRSTDFTITINDNQIVITTNGYGHGVGMSQYGANALAKKGQNYQEILTHYYQKVQINKI